jgi:hypothetical protein
VMACCVQTRQRRPNRQLDGVAVPASVVVSSSVVIWSG